MVNTLENKTVLITGANNTTGIGAAIVPAFARCRARIGLHYLETTSQLIADSQAEAVNNIETPRLK